MIHYMPFTYLNQDQIKRLSSVLGPFAICQLDPSQVPADMQPWVRKGTIVAQHPPGLDATRLQSAIREYQRWGGLHEGRLAAVAGLQRSVPNAPPDDDVAPSRISSQIRHYEDRARIDHAQPERLLNSALFLAMAQIYDEQQDSIHASLAAVQRLEALMISQLSGDAPPQSRAPTSMPSSGFPARDQDRGGFFTSQRIEAWACLAAHLDRAADLYVTSSKMVWDAMLDRWPDAAALGQLSLAAGAADSSQPHPLDAAMQALAASGEPTQIPLDRIHAAMGDGPPAVLTLHVLPGRRPHAVLTALAHQSGPDRWPDGDQRHTVVGYLALG